MGIKGYNGKILHIDLTERTWHIEVPDETWYRIYGGGGLMGTYFMLRDTKAGLDAFDPQNRLIFASSIVAGQLAPGLARFSVVCQSPLSQGIAETRAEGPFGTFLKGSGYDAVIIHGRADSPLYLVLEQGRVQFMPAAETWGKNTFEASAWYEAVHGKDIQSAVIGQAGELKVRFASIVTACSIQAMRMGTGAVMGSKNLKALVLKGCRLPQVADQTALDQITRQYEIDMRQNQLSMWQKDPPGFSAAADLSDIDTAYIGAINYQENLAVETSNFMRSKYLPYYQGHIACPGCPNDCIKLIAPPMGDVRSSGIHQEVTAAFGPNIGNDDLELTLRANVLCNLFGMDPVSLGFTISFAMECIEKKLISEEQVADCPFAFGACENLLQLIESIAFRQGIGDLLAEGSRLAAAKIGGEAAGFALHVKGIEMVSFEPRTQTNLALGYATAPIGPRYDICEHDWDFDVVTGWDHTLKLSRTLGIFERVPMEAISLRKVRDYLAMNTIWSACDALNICVFASAPTRPLSLESISKMIQAVTGWETSSFEFMRWGERRNHLMRLYNVRQGIGRDDDMLPQRFFTEPIRHGRLAGTVLDKQSFARAIDFYYQMMGWDEAGCPLPATLVNHHLETFLEI